MSMLGRSNTSAREGVAASTGSVTASCSHSPRTRASAAIIIALSSDDLAALDTLTSAVRRAITRFESTPSAIANVLATAANTTASPTVSPSRAPRSASVAAPLGLVRIARVNDVAIDITSSADIVLKLVAEWDDDDDDNSNSTSSSLSASAVGTAIAHAVSTPVRGNTRTNRRERNAKRFGSTIAGAHACLCPCA
jgi:hypothetical protein